MRFATRTFLWFAVPTVLLLSGSFWGIQELVQSTVRDELFASLREKQLSLARVRAHNELQSRRFLRIVGENPALKAGIHLLMSNPGSADARLTIEDQLLEICTTLRFDLLLVSSPEGLPLAGVMRTGGRLAAIDLIHMRPPQAGLFTAGDEAFQIASTAIDEGDENIGILSLGERFDFAEFTTPTVLARGGMVLRSNIAGVSLGEITDALQHCSGPGSCEVRLRGETYLSLPVESIYFGDGYTLRTFQSVDAVSRPVQAVIRNVFLLVGFGGLLAALTLAAFSSRSIVKPIAAVVAHLRQGEVTGLLPEFRPNFASVQEITELTESFNRAASAIREARTNLHSAYVEFVGSLANALDARDPYTAGHSLRVSRFACAVAEKLGIEGEALERIRVGALLHDIGKIGISDAVLQKPGKLTAEEFALIKQHPTIGRRILEGVRGFHDYLTIVELHHENWDGSGYPLGMRAEATPVEARIVHVVDAYDAMTSDRPYRAGMRHEEAVMALIANSGTQFDPAIVDAFRSLAGVGDLRSQAAARDQMHSLAAALADGAGIPNPVLAGRAT